MHCGSIGWCIVIDDGGAHYGPVFGGGLGLN